MAVFDPVNGPVIATPDVTQLGLADPNLTPYTLGAGPGFFFGRNWLVTITSLFGVFGYNSLRTVFEIDKSTFSVGNKVKISLYNLNDLSRALYVKGGLITLAVGYGATSAPLLPLCTNVSIIKVHHERKGPDILSHYEGIEGGRAINDTPFTGTFPAGTPAVTILNAIIAAMGLVVGPQVIPNPIVYPAAQSFQGSAKSILDRIVIKDMGLKWWVNGFTVYVAPAAVPAIPNAVVVSNQTGLIGTPNIGGPTGGDSVITFTSLINPFLTPGANVQLISAFTTALAVIKTAKYEGDTHGNKWTVTCEATPINPAALTTLQVSA